MSAKLLPLVFKNLLRRSRTRTIATVLGCITGAFIINLFLCSQNSLSRVVLSAGEDANLIMTQKDKY